MALSSAFGAARVARDYRNRTSPHLVDIDRATSRQASSVRLSRRRYLASITRENPPRRACDLAASKVVFGSIQDSSRVAPNPSPVILRAIRVREAKPAPRVSLTIWYPPGIHPIIDQVRGVRLGTLRLTHNERHPRRRGADHGGTRAAGPSGRALVCCCGGFQCGCRPGARTFSAPSPSPSTGTSVTGLPSTRTAIERTSPPTARQHRGWWARSSRSRS